MYLTNTTQLESSTALSTRCTMKNPADMQLDKPLFTWFIQVRRPGLPVSGPLLQAKAIHSWEKLHMGDHTFTASQGWLNHWNTRHGVRQLKLSGEKLAAPEEVEPFKNKLADIMKKMGLTAAQVYNADETGH